MSMGSVLILTEFNIDIVPQYEILSGGLPQDGIPALLPPKFTRSDKVDFLTPDDQVIGVLWEN